MRTIISLNITELSKAIDSLASDEATDSEVIPPDLIKHRKTTSLPPLHEVRCQCWQEELYTPHNARHGRRGSNIQEQEERLYQLQMHLPTEHRRQSLPPVILIRPQNLGSPNKDRCPTPTADHNRVLPHVTNGTVQFHCISSDPFEICNRVKQDCVLAPTRLLLCC